MWVGVKSRLFNSKACDFSDIGMWVQRHQESPPESMAGRRLHELELSMR